MVIKPNNLISMRVKVPPYKCSGESITPNRRVGIQLLKRGEKEVMINLISNPFEQGLMSNESEGMLILSLSATSERRLTHWSQKAMDNGEWRVSERPSSTLQNLAESTTLKVQPIVIRNREKLPYLFGNKVGSHPQDMWRIGLNPKLMSYCNSRNTPKDSLQLRQ